MLTITNLQGENFKEYILNDVVSYNEAPSDATDYYASKDGLSPFPGSFRMGGEASKEWGIDGDFEQNKELFVQLYDGLHPVTGKPLVQVQKKKDEKGKIKDRRAGLDCTFSAPKSISIALIKSRLDGDTNMADAILKAHREAVSYAMEEISKGAITRSGKGSCIKSKQNKTCYAMIDHIDARPVGDNAPDMALHTHCILFNFAIAKDKKTRAMEQLSINQQVKSGGAIYRAKLAEGLQRAGLAIRNLREKDEFGQTSKVDFELIGVTQEAKDTFSKRRKQVLEYLVENKIPASKMRQYVKSIRNAKGTFSQAELNEEWQRQINALPAEDLAYLDKHGKDEFERIEADTAKLDQKILDMAHDFRKRTMLTAYDIKTIVAQQYTGHADALNLIESTTKRILDGAKVVKFDKKNGLDEVLFCSKRLAICDKLIRDTVEKANGNVPEHHNIPGATIDIFVEKFKKERGFTPSDEQLEAIKRLTSGESISVLRGFAGSGKTTSAQVVAQSFLSEKFNCIGTSMGNDAARKLQEETGIKSCSITKLLADIEKGNLKVDNKTLIYVDEAGMIDLENTAKLIDIQRLTSCRMIFAGDIDQLSSVGPGSGLKVLNNCLESVELKEIRRQKKIEQNKIARKWYDPANKKKVLDIVKDMDENNMIEIGETAQDVIYKIADAYVRNPRSDDEKIVMATTKDSVKYLNQVIQMELIEQGKRDEKALNVIGDYEYREGDLVRFNATRKLDGGKVINGTKGKVIGQDENGRLLIETDTKDRVTVPDDFKDMQLNYAVTVHKAQGQSVPDAYFYADGPVNHNIGLVSSTRHQENFKLFGTADTIELLKDSLTIKDLSDGVYQFISDEDRTIVDEEYRKQYLDKEIIEVEMNTLQTSRRIGSADVLGRATQKMKEQELLREKQVGRAREEEQKRVLTIEERWAMKPKVGQNEDTKKRNNNYNY